MNADGFRQLALSFEGTSEAAHFDRAAFRTTRRIFATMCGGEVNLKLSSDQQAMVLKMSKAFTRIANKWGDQGWTTCVLKDVTAAQMRQVLAEAYADALPAVKTGRRRKP